MSTFADKIAEFVLAELAKRLKTRTAVGTVVTSPSARSTDPLTVVFDGSALTVPVKQFRGFPVFPGMRVGLIKLGSDWVLIGAFTNPGQGTGTARMVIGADTPPELAAFGIDVAILSYVNDKVSGLERGYFWIGTSNEFDGGGDGRVQAFGNVTYPTPGDPGSATVANVKTNFQQNMFAQYAFTIFKDQSLLMWQPNVEMQTQNGFVKQIITDASANLAVQLDQNGVKAGAPGTTNVETWHGATLVNGWTNRGSGFPAFSYRKVPSPAASIQIVGQIVPGTLTDGTTVTTLPVGYRPTTPEMWVARKGASAQAWFELNTDGTIKIFDAAGSSLIQSNSTILPLDI